MRSWRVLLTELSVDGVVVEFDYADVFVVVREGADGPADTDWEIDLAGPTTCTLEPGRHVLRRCSADGHVLEAPPSSASATVAGTSSGATAPWSASAASWPDHPYAGVDPPGWRNWLTRTA